MENKSLIVQIDENSKNIIEEFSGNMQESISKIRNELHTLYNEHKKLLESKYNYIDTKIEQVSSIESDISKNIPELIKIMEDLKKNNIEKQLKEKDDIIKDLKKNNENSIKKFEEKLNKLQSDINYLKLPILKRLFKKGE